MLLHTHDSHLLPVPVAVVIDESVLAMAVVHLSCLSPELVGFSPIVFCCFTVKVAGIQNVG